jgi:hypothetical protein
MARIEVPVDLAQGVGIEGVMECVSEIAQTLVYSLPDNCLPQETSKFIGRPILEGDEVVATRIFAIMTKIHDLEETTTVSLDVVLKRLVPKTIRQILLKNFKHADRVLANSNEDRPESVAAANDFKSFNNFIRAIYGNGKGNSSVSK